ncbi:hypothetical protein F5X98DRAFT_383519 [Xylaria grammica]|nr:hypothetical protein F5X98DRAFT_383519 [Xylaria grammica]
MYSTKVLLFIAAFAGTSLSQKSDSAFCSAEGIAFNSLVETGPTTPAAILSFIASQTASSSPAPTGSTIPSPEGHQSQLCSLATALPSSLLPEFQTLASELSSFGKAHSSDFIAYITNCAPEDQVASLTNYLDYVFTATGNICQDTYTPTPVGTLNGTYPTATPTASAALNGTTSLIPTAAAARPTGALWGVAAAGVVGAAAML